ncbi:hypothetical protein [Parapedobacter tibetensis]|uniref:hypothetical protein n=1 Tax=Parapedobacter tibetensis TaxID=2972951 RepID=UPI00214D8543|nr:hypothetical protein [Parapedobacter tibetensis]
MQRTIFKQAFAQLFTLVTLCFIAVGFTTGIGLDSYEIYLNNKLILKQSVNQPLSLRKLQLGKTNDNDQLRIYYKHCTVKGSGTDRSIILKDEKGNILKKWEFANTTGSNTDMVISAKELSQLKKDNVHRDLSLHYTAQELPKGEMLAFLSP